MQCFSSKLGQLLMTFRLYKLIQCVRKRVVNTDALVKFADPKLGSVIIGRRTTSASRSRYTTHNANWEARLRAKCKWLSPFVLKSSTYSCLLLQLKLTSE